MQSKNDAMSEDDSDNDGVHVLFLHNQSNIVTLGRVEYFILEGGEMSNRKKFEAIYLSESDKDDKKIKEFAKKLTASRVLLNYITEERPDIWNPLVMEFVNSVENMVKTYGTQWIPYDVRIGADHWFEILKREKISWPKPPNYTFNDLDKFINAHCPRSLPPNKEVVQANSNQDKGEVNYLLSLIEQPQRKFPYNEFLDDHLETEDGLEIDETGHLGTPLWSVQT